MVGQGRKESCEISNPTEKGHLPKYECSGELLRDTVVASTLSLNEEIGLRLLAISLKY